MPPQNNINRLPQVLLHFHLEEYITKSIMMLCILRVQQWPFFSSVLIPEVTFVYDTFRK